MSVKPLAPNSTSTPRRDGSADVGTTPHVICGTDFTDLGREAASVAAAIARAMDLPLALVHAVHQSPTKNLPPELQLTLAQFQQNHLDQEALRLSEQGTTVVEVLRAGRPGAVLIEAAKTTHARLLVLARGRHMVPADGHLGLAEHLAETLPIPTLVVRVAAPLFGWLQKERTLRVFVTADLSPTSEAAIRWAAALADLGPVHFTLAHLDPELALSTDDFAACSSSLRETLLRRDRLSAQVFRGYVRRLLKGHKATIRALAGWSHSDAHLIHLAEEEKADLMVIGSGPSGMMPRLGQAFVSRGLLHYAPTNVATIPIPLFPSA